MSIEQKIAELLAESKAAQLAEQIAEDNVEVIAEEETIVDGLTEEQFNNLSEEEQAEYELDEASSCYKKKAMKEEAVEEIQEEATEEFKVDVSADVAALINGEELTEEFKTKAATIFEAAVVTRVKQEVAKLEEEYASLLSEETAKIAEGVVEKVDGYLNYVVEQWIAQNELALEHGMKSEILEGFVAGLKGLFQEHYIDIPDEKFDVLGEMESKIEELETKLNEQVTANVELNKTVGEMKRTEIVEAACEGLADTEVEKFKGLAEELAYEDVESFKQKVQTIRESYFTTKAQADVASVVTDTPVETLVEEKKVDPTMAKYLAALNQFKK
jgi:hypothetical protein